jgi:transcriptional regulator with XRE-family HTH domain
MGARLKRVREGAGMSQSQLAAAAGVPIGTLRNWEQDRRVPLLDTAARVAKALRVSLDELAGGDAATPAPAPLPAAKPAPRRRKRGG